PRPAFQQSFDRFEIAPFQFQSVGAVGAEQSFFPRLECQPRAAGVVAALDAEIVDALGKIKHVVAFEAEIVKRVHPFAAGVEMPDFAFEAPLADLHVPRAHARALKAGAERHAILIEAFGLVGDDRAAPVQFRDRAPVFAVADAGQAFFYRGFARQDRLRPARAGVNRPVFIVQARALGAPGDEGFEFFRAHHRAEAVGCGVIVIVHQHRRANQIFAGGADAADARVLMARFSAQNLLGVADAFAPDVARVAQRDLVFADVKILRRRCGAGDDHAVVAGILKGRAEVAAGGTAAESAAS